MRPDPLPILGRRSPPNIGLRDKRSSTYITTSAALRRAARRWKKRPRRRGGAGRASNISSTQPSSCLETAASHLLSILKKIQKIYSYHLVFRRSSHTATQFLNRSTNELTCAFADSGSQKEALEFDTSTAHIRRNQILLRTSGSGEDFDA